MTSCNIKYVDQVRNQLIDAKQWAGIRDVNLFVGGKGNNIRVVAKSKDRGSAKAKGLLRELITSINTQFSISGDLVQKMFPVTGGFATNVTFTKKAFKEIEEIARRNAIKNAKKDSKVTPRQLEILFPETRGDINYQQPSIEKVQELFESNPELANEIYEALNLKIDKAIGKDLLSIEENEIPKKEGESFSEMQTRVKQNINIRKRIEIANENNIKQGKLYSFSELERLLNNSIFDNDIYNDLRNILPQITFRFGSLNKVNKKRNGYYDSSNNTINLEILHLPNSDFKRTLLHEIIHTATFINLGEDAILTATQKTALDNLNNLIEELKKDRDFFGEYGLTDANELLAELANKNFVNKLKKKTFSDNQSFFEKIISEIVKLLGLNTTAYDIVKESFDSLVKEYKPINQITPQQKQQATFMFSEFLDVYLQDFNQVEKILKEENTIEKDCTSGGKLKAEKGLQTNFTKGGKWELIKDLKGYPTHKEGGVDLTIGKDGVIIKNGNTQFTAKHGLVIPSWINPKNWGVTDYSDKGDFNTAYSTARREGKKEFLFKDSRYSTAMKPVAGDVVQKREDFEPINNWAATEAAGGKRRQETYGNLGDLYAYFAGQPLKSNTLHYSKYRPTNSKDLNAQYIAIKDDKFINEVLENYDRVFNKKELLKGEKEINTNTWAVSGYTRPTTQQLNKQKQSGNKGDLFYEKGKDHVSNAIGRYFLSKGKDDRGDYISYYDIFDRGSGKSDSKGLLTAPFEIYDRIYIKDYGDGKQKRMYYTDKELSELNIDKKDFDTLGLQRELSNRGYKLPKSTKQDGSLDGVWGDETKNALLEYRKSQNKSKH